MCYTYGYGRLTLRLLFYSVCVVTKHHNDLLAEHILQQNTRLHTSSLFRDGSSTTRSHARCESNALACVAPCMTRGHRMYYVARHSCCVACRGIPTHSLHMYGPMSRHHAGAVVSVACTRARCPYYQRCCAYTHQWRTAASTVHDTQLCSTHNVAYVCVHHRVCCAVGHS